jgi:hypothetical protein
MIKPLRGGRVDLVHPYPRGPSRPRMNHYDSDLGLCSERPHNVFAQGVDRSTCPPLDHPVGEPDCLVCGWPLNTVGREVNCEEPT